MKKDTSKETKKYSHLCLEEREEIAISLEKGLKQYEIAVLLNRNPGTISREIKRNISTIRNAGYRNLTNFAEKGDRDIHVTEYLYLLEKKILLNIRSVFLLTAPMPAVPVLPSGQ